MKKTFQFLLMLLLASFATRAQLSTYSFTYGNENFESIESSSGINIQVPPYTLVDFSGYLFPNFPLNNIKAFGHPRSSMNAEYDETGFGWQTFYNGTFGEFGMNAAGLSFYTLADGWSGWAAFINQFNHDTMFVYEFHNVVFDAVNSPGVVSKFTFQMSIHTIDNSIEFRYGPAVITPGSTLAEKIIIGLFYSHPGGPGGSAAHFTLTLTGNPGSPTLTTDSESNGLSGWPAANTVYSFTPAPLPPPNPTKINEQPLLAEKVKIYPVPANNSMHVTFDGLIPEKAIIINALGQQIKEIQTKNGQALNINTRNISNGTYFLKIKFPQETINKKFTVSH